MVIAGEQLRVRATPQRDCVGAALRAMTAFALPPERVVDRRLLLRRERLIQRFEGRPRLLQALQPHREELLAPARPVEDRALGLRAALRRQAGAELALLVGRRLDDAVQLVPQGLLLGGEVQLADRVGDDPGAMGEAFLAALLRRAPRHHVPHPAMVLSTLMTLATLMAAEAVLAHAAHPAHPVLPRLRLRPFRLPLGPPIDHPCPRDCSSPT